MQTKAIELNGRPLGAPGMPAICAPLVGRTREQLLAEARVVAAKRPDLLEWRVDYFDAIGDTAAVLDTAAALREAGGGLPLLFTRRSQREGGEPTGLGELQAVALYRAICEERLAALVDYEMGNDAGLVRELRESSKANGVALILSYHNFKETPPLAQLVERFLQAERMGADVAKVAVMPRNPEDVLRLLKASAQASRRLSIPLVSMSMAALGSVSRLCGGVFGSALTFAVGQDSSAPGQIEIEDVRAGVAILARAMAQAPTAG